MFVEKNLLMTALHSHPFCALLVLTCPASPTSSCTCTRLFPNIGFSYISLGVKGDLRWTCRHIKPWPSPPSDACQLTLDPNTVGKFLQLTEGNREATCVDEQPYPDHPERFEGWAQVLCREGLSERCYWEAEWRGPDGVDIALAYKEISRKGGGDDAALGWNNKSWSLRCTPSSYYFWYNKESTKIPVPSSSRIGVYLDHRAGILSFYSVSDTMTLLHRVQTTFTQPLYPGFEVHDIGSYVKLCDLEWERGEVQKTQKMKVEDVFRSPVSEGPRHELNLTPLPALGSESTFLPLCSITNHVSIRRLIEDHSHLLLFSYALDSLCRK